MQVREYKPNDSKAVQTIWQKAFAGPPWYENLSHEEMERRWQACCKKNGFGCLLMQHDEKIVGFISWHTPTIDELIEERGQALATFATQCGRSVVWLEVTCTDPDFQKKGVARTMREYALSKFQQSNGFLLLTRHREDNIPIINLSRSMGFLPVGIKVPSSQVHGIHHEYWYLKCT